MVLLGSGTGAVLPLVMLAMSVRVAGRERGAVAERTNSASAVGFILAPFVGLGLHMIAPPTSFVALAALGGDHGLAVLARCAWNSALVRVPLPCHIALSYFSA